MDNKNKLIAGCLMFASSELALAETSTVNFYNWPDYVGPTVIDNFTKETGITVNYDVFDSNEVVDAKLMTGASGYDVIIPASSYLQRQAKIGVYSEIDHDRLKNYKNLNKDLLSKARQFDPENKHSIPYAWGTIGLGYNETMLRERLGDMPLDSLDLIFDPEISSKLKDCGISILESPAEVTSIALNYLGLDPNSENKKDLKKATDLLKKSRPNYKQFSSFKHITDLVNGDICVALSYNGDVSNALVRAEEAGVSVNLGYSIPKEGTLLWFDFIAIPADAPNPEGAYAFIDYLLRSDSAADFSNYTFFASANDAAKPLLLDEIMTDPGIYPSDEVKQRLFAPVAHTAKFDRLLTRAWTDIKTGR
ncbi:polyamine ABC transporter substrate-binding protein [Aliamphritea ceti]|uniref:polyamine ABC transporter substrate-binding protein n=1 Tax=Aliamphritea ceti TaxID=1524258 RepID=UPI0021C4A6C8|nr:polyamine ABC transporter substrate-binding protein [Aliamphritea ceti]